MKKKDESKGEYEYPNGAIYERDNDVSEWYTGDFPEDGSPVPHGKGKLTIYDEDYFINEYIGEFKYGSKHGKGQSSVESGATFIGTWEDDKKHGEFANFDHEGKLRLVRFNKGKYVEDIHPNDLKSLWLKNEILKRKFTN